MLLEEAARINRPEFIASDPVQFPRRFEDVRDIEIAALLTATISWGKRTMILKSADRMMSLLDNQPYQYMMDKGYEDLDSDLNIHRTFFARNLQWYLRGLRELYSRYGNLDAFSKSIGAGEKDAPAWYLVEQMMKILTDANSGNTDSRCLPSNLKTTALKRINMALRWLVRDDGIVDMGVWTSIPKKKLYIPLDVHVGNTARNLGLITRKQADRKSAEEITEVARVIKPDDPALLDYALFGIGIGE
ncbi:MAG: TIGR02757 family protein [Muribaculaceae bacterium]|nr:TIGR02757 family protein [Muribaculaceae bacterium]